MSVSTSRSLVSDRRPSFHHIISITRIDMSAFVEDLKMIHRRLLQRFDAGIEARESFTTGYTLSAHLQCQLQVNNGSSTIPSALLHEDESKF